MAAPTEGLTLIAEVNVPYDVDLTWNGGCRGKDMVGTPPTGAYDEESLALESGEQFRLLFYLDARGDIYVDINPHNDAHEYMLSGDKLSVWQDSGWRECTLLKGLSDLPKAEETTGIAWNWSRSLSDKDFRACAAFENPKAFEEQAVRAFFQAFDACYTQLSTPRDGHSVSLKFEKALP